MSEFKYNIIAFIFNHGLFFLIFFVAIVLSLVLIPIYKSIEQKREFKKLQLFVEENWGSGDLLIPIKNGGALYRDNTFFILKPSNEEFFEINLSEIIKIDIIAPPFWARKIEELLNKQASAKRISFGLLFLHTLYIFFQNEGQISPLLEDSRQFICLKFKLSEGEEVVVDFLNFKTFKKFYLSIDKQDKENVLTKIDFFT